MPADLCGQPWYAAGRGSVPAASRGCGRGRGRRSASRRAAATDPAAGDTADAAAAAAAVGAEGKADRAAAGRSGKPPQAEYRLHAVLNHKGPAASCGHFTSDIRDAGKAGGEGAPVRGGRV